MTKKYQLESKLYNRKLISTVQITSMTPTYIQIFVNNVKIVIVCYMFLVLLDDWYKTGIRDTM